MTKPRLNKAWLSLLAMTTAIVPLLIASEGDGNHWAYKPVKAPEVPKVETPGWVTNPIDAFILRKLKENGLEPADPAPRTALLRRAYYDLIGLPPTPQQVKNFLADESPDAFKKVVEELLDSPHYGERWGRHWLDIVRYGESNSYERDNPKPNVWRYRDYVIRAFNEDKPYDQFVREQLAGDELDKVTADSITATGYYRLGIWDDEPTDRLQARYDELDDIIGTTGQVFLGATIHCARCHDHKLDPIPQSDYYSLLAFFHNIRGTSGNKDHSILTEIASQEDLASREREVRRHEDKKKEVAERIQGYESRILQAAQGEGSIEETDPKRRAELIKDFIDKVLDEKDRKRYDRDLKYREHLNKNVRYKPFPKALSVKENGRTAPETFVLVRGNAHVKGDKVEPAFFSALGFPKPEIPEAPEGIESSGRRRVLADWIVSPENPLSSRVMINRIWHYHFGRGIVASPNNFGLAGNRPTHPELLDWLAAEFVNNNWSIKAMHRLIMLSSTYRMSSAASDKAMAEDPSNYYLSHVSMRRLTAEEIRDSILQVNGRLNKNIGGPSIYPKLPKEVLETQSRPGANWGRSSESDAARRSVYIHVKRSLLVPMMTSFDFADPDSTCAARFSTTQPTQALNLLNSEFTNQEADHFADYLEREAGGRLKDQVRLGLQLAFSREPTTTEIDRAAALAQVLQEEEKISRADAMKRVCLAFYNLNEFMFLD